MSPHDALVNETREWLQHAQADLNACDALMAAGLLAEALFHAQQCAEKAIKAVLTWHQISFKKTHDLDELRQVCLPLAGCAAVHLTGIESLSQYAWRFRYPGAPYSPGRIEAEEARQAAARLQDAWWSFSNLSSATERIVGNLNNEDSCRTRSAASRIKSPAAAPL